MKVIQHEPLGRWIEEVDGRERKPRPLGAEVLACEEEDGHGSERNGDRLDDEEHARVRPQPPERSKQHDQRIEVRAEPRDLLAVQVGDLEQPAMRGRPHGLSEVADIESPRFEGPLRLHRKRRHPGGKRSHRDPEQRTRPAHVAAIARSSKSSHCAPSTASLARRTYVARPAAPILRARSRIGGEAPHRRGEGSGIPWRHEQSRQRRRSATRVRRACRR